MAALQLHRSNGTGRQKRDLENIIQLSDSYARQMNLYCTVSANARSFLFFLFVSFVHIRVRLCWNVLICDVNV